VRLQRAAFDPTKIIDTARGGHRASGARDGLDMIRQLRRPRPRIAPGADRESIACELRARPAGDRVRVEFMANSERDAPSRWGSSRAIRTVLAVRQYQSRPVPDAVLERIVEAGRLTGSGMNGQPWHFIVVRDAETLRRLGAMAPSGPYVAQAPLAIVVATEKSRVAVSDASLAIQSMLLTAWADGVGANWVGFGGVGGVKTLLGIPAGLDVFAILPFGYPARPGMAKAYEGYWKAFGNDRNHFYSGLNALGMVTILLELSRRLPDVWAAQYNTDEEARRALEAFTQQRKQLEVAVDLAYQGAQRAAELSGRPNKWLDISAADLALLMGMPAARVENRYRRALADGQRFHLAGARRQLAILDRLGVLAESAKAALAVVEELERALPPDPHVSSPAHYREG
jgi:nitroreductase